MKKFIGTSFLLNNDKGRELYQAVAANLPVIDYHNHLNPQHLAEDKKFMNIAELWVTGDPYKHRAMRINGIPEEGITGAASDFDKYMNWVTTIPKTLGNPLFHWTNLEMSRVFGVDELLNEKNAVEIWHHCNSKLQDSSFGALGLLRMFNAEIVCTSDDLTDNISFHQVASKPGFKVLPSLRSDSMVAFDSPGFKPWLEKLSEGKALKNINGYKACIIEKLDRFKNAGCRLADHSLDGGFLFVMPDDLKAEKQFSKVLNDELLSPDELINLKAHMLVFLGNEYARRKWLMQLHLGAHRFTSSRLRKLAGPAGGYACLGKACDIGSLVQFLDALELDDLLPKTILYTLNPADNEAFATITGSFAQDGVAGKIQFGPAWWYNDHYEGIRQQLISLSSYGLMSHFIGMTTDSRSLLSFSRHEYFRRVVCNLIGEWVEAGILPDDESLLKGLVADISYKNSKRMIEGE